MMNAVVYLAACWQEHELGIVFRPRKPRGERLDHELHLVKRLVRKKRSSETPHLTILSQGLYLVSLWRFGGIPTSPITPVQDLKGVTQC